MSAGRVRLSIVAMLASRQEPFKSPWQPTPGATAGHLGGGVGGDPRSFEFLSQQYWAHPKHDFIV